MKQYGLKIVIGYDYAPPLPRGWQIIRDSKKAAIAVAPDGKRYLIGDGVLYLLLDGPKVGTAKPTTTYIDTDSPLKWPEILKIVPQRSTTKLAPGQYTKLDCVATEGCKSTSEIIVQGNP